MLVDMLKVLSIVIIFYTVSGVVDYVADDNNSHVMGVFHVK